MRTGPYPRQPGHVHWPPFLGQNSFLPSCSAQPENYYKQHRLGISCEQRVVLDYFTYLSLHMKPNLTYCFLMFRMGLCLYIDKKKMVKQWKWQSDHRFHCVYFCVTSFQILREKNVVLENAKLISYIKINLYGYYDCFQI